MHPAFEEVPCNFCGGTDATVVYPPTLPADLSIAVTKRFAPSDHASGNDRIVRCTACDFVFASPRMKPEHMWQGYADAVDERYAAQGKDRRETFARALRRIEAYLPARGRILDVGCAAGFFLKVAKDHGWDVEGIEPNRGLAAWGSREYGVPIRTEDFLTSSHPPGHFDAITFWDVIEHVPDPAASLQKSFALLRPGGYLIVNFPDFGSALARLAGPRWWFLSPVHISYFTRPTLQRFLERAGFAVETMERHFQTLALGYLFERFESYSRPLSRLGVAVTRGVGIANLPIRYYASQAVAIARKPETT